ncbi:hypothetical protein [Thiohalospira halophila]|uniref:hypothetical protein n=1 Tax=Thiohalospira halophila TaxID=381300 RepID=UPI0013563CF6|nr:hypothetical protein [Thiohalospira halophila]
MAIVGSRLKLTDIPDLATRILALLFAISLLFGRIVDVSRNLWVLSGLSFGLAGILLTLIPQTYYWCVDVLKRRFKVGSPQIEKIDSSVKSLAPIGLASASLLVFLDALGHPLAIAATITVLLHTFLLLLLSSVTLESPEPLIDAVLVVMSPTIALTAGAGHCSPVAP